MDIRIPMLGVTMEEATLSAWLVEDGSYVKEGTPLYTLEMEKAVQEVEAPVSGTLKIIGNIGQAYRVGDTIGRLD